MTYTHSTTFTAGSTYFYKVVAENKYGVFETLSTIQGGSTATSAGSIKAAERPSTPNAPTVSVSAAQTHIDIDFSGVIVSNNGESITEYEIYINTNAGTEVTDNTYCDGSQFTEASSSKVCSIPFSALTSAPYSFDSTSDTIYAKVQIKNSRGWSDTSVASNTATMRLVPGAPAISLTATFNTATVTWTAPADNGGSVITSYNIQWDAGVSGGPWIDLVGNTQATPAQSPYLPGTLSYTRTTGIVAGTTYTFRIRAENIYGQGSFSTSSVVAESKPD